MKIPLWYQVKTHQISYDSFLEKYETPKGLSQGETFLIFCLSCAYNHNPYTSSGSHILHDLTNNSIITEEALRCFYSYSAFGNDRKDECVIEGELQFGTFKQFDIQFPSTFDHSYVEQWIHLLINSFLPIGVNDNPLSKYQSGNMKSLKKCIEHYCCLKTDGFKLSNITSNLLYRLYNSYISLSECKGLFLGCTYPKFLKPYRDNLTVFRKLTRLYWPDVLKSFELERPFNQDELNLISEAHQKLYDQGDVNFLFHYVSMFSKCFEGLPITQTLKNMIVPSPKNDLLRINKYLFKLTPDQRSLILPFDIPVSDLGVDIFLKQVEADGFEQTLTKYLKAHEDRMMSQFTSLGGVLYNTEILESGDSVFDYPMSQLILYSDGRNYYAFTQHEIHELADTGLNPFNRSPIPLYLFKYGSEEPNKTYYEIWENILKREVKKSS